MLSEFERKAWDNRSGADKHKPEMALKVVLDDIATGKEDCVIHAIIVLVHEEGDMQHVSIHQAGRLETFAVEGALSRAMAVSRSAE